MSQHSTVHSRREVVADGANDDSVCAWGLITGEGAGRQDREFEVRWLGVLEFEVLVILKNRYTCVNGEFVREKGGFRT